MRVGREWEESKINEHSNSYVDDFCDRCALLWGYLLKSENRLPQETLKLTWGNLVEGAYLSLLEGFSGVRFCSTEGRALMSMDLASFSSGVSKLAVIERLEGKIEATRAPPTVDIHRGREYVDTYVKVFYFPEEVSTCLFWLELSSQLTKRLLTNASYVSLS